MFIKLNVSVNEYGAMAKFVVLSSNLVVQCMGQYSKVHCRGATIDLFSLRKLVS